MKRILIIIYAMSTRGEKRKKPYKKIRRSNASLGVVRMVRPELKKGFQLMTTMGLDSVGTAWREYDIVGQIIPGAGVNSRVGRRIEIHSCRFRGILTGGATGGGPVDEYYNNIRLMIYTMKQNKTAALTPAATAGYVINTPLNKLYMPGLEKVLYDRFIGMTNQPWAANSCSPATREVDMYKKFKNPILCNFTGDLINYNQFQIYVSMVTDSGAVPHPGFTSGYFEVSYYDV